MIGTGLLLTKLPDSQSCPSAESVLLKRNFRFARSSTTSAVRTAGTSVQEVAFAEVESSMYKRRRTAMPSLPRNPQSSDQAVSVSRFASLGSSSFYRGGQVTDGNNDTALMFATDGQLELLRSSRLIFDSTFHVVPRLYYQLFTVFVSHVVCTLNRQIAFHT